jgi:ankyrin repeat protein
MLNANLFGHLEPAPKLPHMKKVRVKKLDKGIRPTLVHELFHDFWYDVLDQRKRFLFSVEAEIFFMELLLAKTELEKKQFLWELGINPQGNIDFESYEVLREIQDIYRMEKLGTEIFAILAGRAYSGKTVIPKPFQKYYSMLLSDEVLDRGHSLSPPPSGQEGKIQAAKQAADLAELKTSIEKNPNLIHIQDQSDFTLLHHASFSGNLEAVQLLIEKGADLSARATGISWTPFHLASLRGHKKIVEYLIGHGAHAEVKDAKGRSPVHIASLRGHQELIALLLRQGAKVHSQDDAGMMPLHWAALYGEKGAAVFLVSNGASTKAKDSAGQTPLHLASFCGDKNLVKLLIAGGASIDDRDNNGDTALHLAAFCGHENVVEWLVEHGAKSDIENNRGESPGETASKAGHKKIAELLSDAAY